LKILTLIYKAPCLELVEHAAHGASVVALVFDAGPEHPHRAYEARHETRPCRVRDLEEHVDAAWNLSIFPLDRLQDVEKEFGELALLVRDVAVGKFTTSAVEVEASLMLKPVVPGALAC
jgi:hypothetical protein